MLHQSPSYYCFHDNLNLITDTGECDSLHSVKYTCRLQCKQIWFSPYKHTCYIFSRAWKKKILVKTFVSALIYVCQKPHCINEGVSSWQKLQFCKYCWWDFSPLQLTIIDYDRSRDFYVYEVMVDESEARVNYHLIELESE